MQCSPTCHGLPSNPEAKTDNDNLKCLSAEVKKPMKVILYRYKFVACAKQIKHVKTGGQKVEIFQLSLTHPEAIDAGMLPR